MTTQLEHWEHIQGETVSLAHQIEITLAANRGVWLSCYQMVLEIFGPGPYSYEAAVALNKIQSWAKKLWEEGRIERATYLEDGLLRYRVS